MTEARKGHSEGCLCASLEPFLTVSPPSPPEVRKGVEGEDFTIPHHHPLRGVGCGEEGKRGGSEVGKFRDAGDAPADASSPFPECP